MRIIALGIVILNFLLINVCAQEAVEVISIGYGNSATEAQKDAIRSAVQQAVGLLVESETLTKNESVINDQILTYSDGFIEKIEEISPPKMAQSGFFETKIKAFVKKNKVTEKLKELNVAITKVEGLDLWAQAVSKIQGVDDAKAMLEKFFDDHKLAYFLVSRVVDDKGNKGESAKPSTKADPNRKGYFYIAFNVEIYFDLKAYYNNAAPKLIKLLDNIGKQINPSYVRNTPENTNRFKIAVTGYPIRSFTTLPHSQYMFAVNIGRDKLGMNQRFAIYQLDELYEGILKTLSEQKINSIPRLNIYLIDKQGDIIIQDNIDISYTLHESSSNYNKTFIKLENSYTYSASSYFFYFPYNNSAVISPEFTDFRKYFYDTILVRYETTLHEDDLKELAQIKVQF
ncbi:MAG: hypothetical protein HQK76_20510 [Desulfobacterales bacterium]|nr:hypothetical protein [Desulfobacterales bacterium]